MGVNWEDTHVIVLKGGHRIGLEKEQFEIVSKLLSQKEPPKIIPVCGHIVMFDSISYVGPKE